MAKYFLASVADAIGFQDNKPVLYAKTLTDSSISFSSSMEEVRAGKGAKLYGRFNHSTGMTIQLTDTMFDMNYIGLQLGSKVTREDSSVLVSESLNATNGKVTIAGTPAAIGKSCGLDGTPVWYRKAGCKEDDAYLPATIAGQEVTLAETYTGAVCVSYFADQKAVETLIVNANFVPTEMVLVLTADLYAGDASNTASGSKVGSVTIKVPRFQLDGSFDLSMAMSSAATLNLNGTALATESGDCEGQGAYAEIVKVVNGETSEVKAIAFDPESMIAGQAPIVIGVYKDGKTGVLSNSDTNLTFSPALTDGKLAAGSITATYAVDGKTIDTDTYTVA